MLNKLAVANPCLTGPNEVYLHDIDPTEACLVACSAICRQDN